MAVDSFSHPSSNALNELDPLSRAVVDLSLKRGMSDDEIAEVLGTDSDSVLENRAALLRSLAEQVAPESVDADLPELEAIVADRLYGNHDGAVEAEPEAEAEPQAEPQAEPERKRRSPLAVLLPLLVLVALVAGIVLIASGGGDDDTSDPAADRPQTSAPAADAERIRLTAVGGGDARGTATVDGNRLRLRVTGLAKGETHQVWLYDSIIDARSLGRLSRNGTLRATLPGNARDFKYLDVSREPADGNANHSGQSVLRVPTRELR